MLLHRTRIDEQPLVLDAAEIGAFEQLRRQDDLRPFVRGFADQLGDLGDVFGLWAGQGELQGGDGDFGHAGAFRRGSTCCATRHSHMPIRMRPSGWIAG